jgi:hypothetical protein
LKAYRGVQSQVRRVADPFDADPTTPERFASASIGAVAPQLRPFERDVLAAVHDALCVHGENAAVVTCEWFDGAKLWQVHVVPKRRGAAAVWISFLGDELVLGFGWTRVELWRSRRGPTPVAQLRQFLAAIFAGRFVEAGRGDDRFARVELAPDERISVGAAHLPIPWTMRRRHYYDAYS